MPIDDGQSVDIGCPQGIGDVRHHRNQCAGTDTDGPGETDVFVGAGDRYWREEEQAVLRCDPAGDAACHNRVGDERKVVAVLLEAAHRKYGRARRPTTRLSSMIALPEPVLAAIVSAS